MASIVPEITTEATKELPLKRICAERFLYAIFYCVLGQYFLFFLFLFFLNFHLNPVVWMKQSTTLLFSVSTWFWSTPLITAVILHGIFLAKSCLSLKKFYSTQFSMLTHTAVKRTIFLTMYMLIGYLTAWLYSTFLSKPYASLFRPCNDNQYCLSEKYLFLTVGGLFAGAYYFFKVHLKDTGITFPVVQQSKFIRVRACLCETVSTSMAKAVQPTIFYAIAYSVVRSPITSRIQSLFGLEVDDTTGYFDLVTDLRQLISVWLLLTQVLVNMTLMRTLFEIFITEHKEFLIENLPSGYEVNLIEALSADKIQIVQQLAALDLYHLSDSKDSQRRQQFYQLSVPGGHPYNWKHLSDQCLRLMKNYTNALATAIETEKDFGLIGRPVNNTSSYYNTTLLGRPMTPAGGRATEMAEKILNRQYNESSGIRNLLHENYCTSPVQSGNEVDDAQQNAVFEAIQKRIDSCRKAILSAPGFYYLFNESKNSKISFILSQSPTIISITKGLTAIVTHSIAEDRYGVVQNDLAAILKTLLQTKAVLEKIGASNVDVKKVDRNYIALKNATRRSIYRIATVFSDYINDLALDANDLKILQNFIYYKEL